MRFRVVSFGFGLSVLFYVSAVAGASFINIKSLINPRAEESEFLDDTKALSSLAAFSLRLAAVAGYMNALEHSHSAPAPSNLIYSPHFHAHGMFNRRVISFLQFRAPRHLSPRGG